MEAPDSTCGLFQRRSFLSGNPSQRRKQILSRKLEIRNGARLYLVESPAVAENGGVSAPAHVGDDRFDDALHARILRSFVACKRGELRIEVAPRRRKASQLHRAAFRKASISGCSSARRVLSAAWLTMRREVTGMISSTGTRSFARSVSPVATRSTIASARPSS